MTTNNNINVANNVAQRNSQDLCEGCSFKNKCEKYKESQKLKSLLKEWIHFYPIILYEHEDTLKTKDIIELYDRTREVLND